MTTLRAVAGAPAISSTTTVEEVLRAAYAAFPTPSPLVKCMIEHLEAMADEVEELRAQVKACEQSSSEGAEAALHCPACGAALHLEL